MYPVLRGAVIPVIIPGHYDRSFRCLHQIQIRGTLYDLSVPVFVHLIRKLCRKRAGICHGSMDLYEIYISFEHAFQPRLKEKSKPGKIQYKQGLTTLEHTVHVIYICGGKTADIYDL